MFKKNPDLIDKYLILFICSFSMCGWILFSTLSSVVLWGYFMFEYVNFYGDLFTIIDFAVFVLVFILWYLSIALMCESFRLYNRAYRSFMES